MSRNRVLGAIPFLAVVLSACLVEGGQVVFYGSECPDTAVYGHLDRDGNLDPCCKDQTMPCTDGGVRSPACGGDNMCVDLTRGTDDFDEVPKLLWYGDAGQAPPCPGNARADIPLHRDPLAVNTCPLCECGTPACVLPVGMITSDTSTDCTGPTFTNFNASPDGSCNSPEQFPPNKVKSLSLQPATLTACTPKQDIPKDVKSEVWRKDGKVCIGLGNGVCPDPENQACVPRPPATPPGFRLCVESRSIGDETSTCPDAYPNPINLYEEVDYQIACSPCGCDAPMGSKCIAAVSAYTDTLCQSQIFAGYLVSNAPPPFPCALIQPNVGLQSIREAWVVNEPGTCAPIDSKPTGKLEVNHSRAHRFCCQGEAFDP